MKTIPLKITLTYLGSVVAEVASESLATPLTIGRDETCGWRPPTEDRTMHAKVATLSLHGKSVLLKAEVGESFRVNAVPMSERTLQLGDRVAIGDCEITVAEAVKRRAYAPNHRLEAVGGESNGAIADLTGEVFVVGSAETANLRLKDDTVSKVHATLIAHGEEWFIRDEASRNGTRVNAQRLGGKERLLKDGDIVSFGPYEYRYLDRFISHMRTNLSRSLLLAITTALIAVGGWYAFYLRTSDATDYLSAAERAAAVERFALADMLLDEASKARGADASRVLIQRYKTRLGLWRETASTWSAFRKDLAEGRFDRAREKIGRLSLNAPDHWDWNDSTIDERLAEAREAVACVSLERELWRERNDPHVLRETHDANLAERIRLGVDTPGFAEDERDWMKALKTRMLDLTRAVDDNVARYDALTNHMASLNWLSGEVSVVSNEIDSVARNSTGPVRFFAHLVRRPFAQLAGDWAHYESERLALTDFDFRSLGTCHIETTPDDCAVSPALALAQAELVQRHLELDIAAVELREMLARLTTFGATLENDPPALVAFETTNRVEKALACDILDLPRPPSSERTEPAESEYDRLFGYGYLYSYIVEGYYAYPKEIDPEKLSTLRFHPELRTLYMFYAEAKNDLNRLVTQKEFAPLLRVGKVAELGQRLSCWLERYDSIRCRFDAVANEAGGEEERRGILARAVYLYLTPHDRITQENWDDFNRRVMWHRKVVGEKIEMLDPTKSEKTREIVEWVLAHGIPGSVPVKKAWGQR